MEPKWNVKKEDAEKVLKSAGINGTKVECKETSESKNIRINAY